MRFVNGFSRRASLLVALLAGGGHAQPRPVVTASTLLARFATVPGLTARFHEEKRMAILAVPLVSDGTVAYARPARLVRRTTSEPRSVVLIDDGRLRFGGAPGQTIELSSSPVVQQFVDSFLGLVRGDEAALQRAYTVSFRAPDATHAERWELRLEPRAQALRGVFRDITLRGHDVVLTWMLVRETSGDETETTFSDVQPNHAFSPAEAASTFHP